MQARAGDSTGVELRIDSAAWGHRIPWVCGAIVLVALLLDLLLNAANPDGIGSIRRIFNLGDENSLLASMGFVLTILAALTATGGYAVRAAKGASGAWRWAVMACFLGYLGLDDVARLHERVGTAVRELGEASETSLGRLLEAFPSYSWQIVYVPILGGLLLFTVWVLISGGNRRVRAYALLGLCCLAAAVALDFAEGLDAHARWNPYTLIARTYDLRDFTIAWFREAPFDALIHWSRAVEESIEFLGLSLLWGAVVLRAAPDGATVRITPAGAPSAEP